MDRSNIIMRDELETLGESLYLIHNYGAIRNTRF